MACTYSAYTEHYVCLLYTSISNAGAYVRKMALNGYILHIDLAPVKELISLQRRCSNNLNQVAIHAHTYGVYPEEIDGLKSCYSYFSCRGKIG